MEDLGEASFVLRIEMHRDKPRGILGLSQKDIHTSCSQKVYICHCSPGNTPIVKGDKFSNLVLQK